MTHTEDVRRVRFTHVILDANDQVGDAIREAFYANQPYTPIALYGGSLSVATEHFGWMSAEMVSKRSLPTYVRTGNKA